MGGCSAKQRRDTKVEEIEQIIQNKDISSIEHEKQRRMTDEGTRNLEELIRKEIKDEDEKDDTEEEQDLGICANCSTVILEKVITANDSTYHPLCWVCNECSEPLGEKDYYHNEDDPTPYCEECYQELHCFRCHHCKEKIENGEALEIHGKMYHLDHFYCSGCGIHLADGVFYPKEKEAYCLKCYKKESNVEENEEKHDIVPQQIKVKPFETQEDQNTRTRAEEEAEELLKEELIKGG